MRFFLLVFFFALSLRASDFEEGNRAYSEGRWADARRHYENAVDRREWSANLFYNLATAYAQDNAPGRAVLNLERALALEPTHSDARTNLRFLREQTLAKFPQEHWNESAMRLVDLNGWTIVAAFCAWGGILAVSGFLGLMAPKWTTGSTLLLLAAGISVWIFFEEQRRGSAAVIVAKQADARQGPLERSPLVDVLPSGSLVQILSLRGDWAYCRLPGGATAWLPSESAIKVRLRSR